MADLYYQFLCASLRLDRGDAQACLRDPGWHWEELFQRANQEDVLPAVAASVCGDLDLSLPREVSDFFSGVLYLNRQCNRRIREEIKHASELLNGIGVEPVLLKGAAYLAAGVYPDEGSRYLVDIDLLLPQAQLQTAAGVLLSNGYAQDSGDQFGRFRHHHPPLRRPGSVSIELHHRLGMGRCGGLLPAAEVIERATAHEIDGVRVRLPCPEHLLTHLILHSQMQHPYHERIWPPLRAMQDLMQLQRRFSGSVDWISTKNRFRKHGQIGLFMLHLADVRGALGLEPPIPIRLAGVTCLRWYRRRLLRRYPGLRYLDPIYMFSSVCVRRLRVLRSILSTSGGRKHLISQLLGLAVYRRVLTDVVEGRGR